MCLAWRTKGFEELQRMRQTNNMLHAGRTYFFSRALKKPPAEVWTHRAEPLPCVLHPFLLQWVQSATSELLARSMAQLKGNLGSPGKWLRAALSTFVVGLSDTGVVLVDT